MSDAAYDYAKYDGDSRSSWERLTWIEPSQARQARTRGQRDDLTRGIDIDDPVVVSEEIPEPQPDVNQSRRDGVTWQAATAPHSDDRIDLAWKKWDSFDFVTALGVVLLFVGFIATFFPELRKAGLLVPIGLAVMTLGVCGARRRDEHLS